VRLSKTSSQKLDKSLDTGHHHQRAEGQAGHAATAGAASAAVSHTRLPVVSARLSCDNHKRKLCVTKASCWWCWRRCAVARAHWSQERQGKAGCSR